MPSAALSDKPYVNILRGIGTSIVDFVLPLRCAGCGVIVSGQGGFCTDCWEQMDFVGPPWCDACGLPLPFEGEAEQSCGACLATPPKHDGIRAAVAYSDISREIALKLKYSGKIGLAKMIAGQLTRHIAAEHKDAILTPVPLHWTRLWSRSFNQSALIAKSLSEQSGVPFCPDILKRTKRTELLRGKTGKERRKEVAHAFALNPKWEEDIAGRHILLVDDIYTSGATSEGCVKILKAKGAAKVEIFCWARVLRDENQHDQNFTVHAADDMA